MSKIWISICLLATSVNFGLMTVAPKNDCPRMKLKRQWGGKAANEKNYLVPPIEYVVVHHTVTSECRKFDECAEILQNLQNFHMNQLDFADIGYNFLVGNDGVVYEGRGWTVSGAHTFGYNMNSTGIAFIGNYQKKLPSRVALAAARKLLKCGIKLGDLATNYRLIAASQVSNTQSPGLSLYNEIQEWDNWVFNP